MGSTVDSVAGLRNRTPFRPGACTDGMILLLAAVAIGRLAGLSLAQEPQIPAMTP